MSKFASCWRAYAIIVDNYSVERAMIVSWKLRHIDYFVLVPYLVLCGISIIMVYSASSTYVANLYHQAPTTYLIKQAMWVVIGLVLVALTFFFKVKHWRNPILLFIMLLATILSLIYLIVRVHLNPSSAVNGASAWIAVGGFHIQPAEFAKVIIILYLSHLLSNRQHYIQNAGVIQTVKASIWPFMIVFTIIFLVLLQPDTGGMAILAAISLVIFFSSGFPVKAGLVAFGGGFAIIGTGTYFALTKFSKVLANSYQGQRFLAVAHPFSMQQGAGKQLVNSMYAINHGGWFGVGLGNSTMKLGYLPEPYTDFILAIIAEELGIIGAIVVVGLLIFLICRIIYIGVWSKNVYHTLLMYGIATMILVQTAFNVGAVVGILPITGVTLPFISYGGSSLLVLSVAIGLVLNVSARDAHQRELERDVSANA